MGRVTVIIVAAVLVGALATPAAQSVQTAQTGASRPSFEVASIRRNVSADQGASVRPLPGGGLTITNNTLFNIIRNAYSVQGVQIRCRPQDRPPPTPPRSSPPCRNSSG